MDEPPGEEAVDPMELDRINYDYRMSLHDRRRNQPCRPTSLPPHLINDISLNDLHMTVVYEDFGCLTKKNLDQSPHILLMTENENL